MNTLKKFLLPIFAAIMACSSPQMESLEPEEIKEVMTRVCDWQLENLSDSATSRKAIEKIKYVPDNGWIRATFYAGVMANYYATSEKKYLDAVITWGKRNNWLPGSKTRNADHQSVAQVYAEIFFINKDEKVLEGILKNYNVMIEEPLWGPETGWVKNNN